MGVTGCSGCGADNNTGAIVILNYHIGNAGPDLCLCGHYVSTITCLGRGPTTITVLSNKRNGSRSVDRTLYVRAILRTRNVRGSHLLLRSGSTGAHRGVFFSGRVVRDHSLSGSILVIAGRFRRCHTGVLYSRTNLRFRSGYDCSTGCAFLAFCAHRLVNICESCLLGLGEGLGGRQGWITQLNN